jgi:hypothetical protein
MDMIDDILKELRRIGDELGAPPTAEPPTTERIPVWEYTDWGINKNCAINTWFTRRQVGEIVAVRYDGESTRELLAFAFDNFPHARIPVPEKGKWIVQLGSDYKIIDDDLYQALKKYLGGITQ